MPRLLRVRNGEWLAMTRELKWVLVSKPAPTLFWRGAGHLLPGVWDVLQMHNYSPECEAQEVEKRPVHQPSVRAPFLDSRFRGNDTFTARCRDRSLPGFWGYPVGAIRESPLHNCLIATSQKRYEGDENSLLPQPLEGVACGHPVPDSQESSSRIC